MLVGRQNENTVHCARLPAQGRGGSEAALMATCSQCRARPAVYRVKSTVMCAPCFRKTERGYREGPEPRNTRKQRRHSRDMQPNVERLKGHRR